MNMSELAGMLKKLNDEAAVIRGYARIALEKDQPNRSKKYIDSIIRQTDRITALNNLITALYLSGNDDNHVPGRNINKCCTFNGDRV